MQSASAMSTEPDLKVVYASVLKAQPSTMVIMQMLPRLLRKEKLYLGFTCPNYKGADTKINMLHIFCE